MNIASRRGPAIQAPGRLLTVLLSGTLFLGAACSGIGSLTPPSQPALTATAPARPDGTTGTAVARATTPSATAAGRTATPQPRSGAQTPAPGARAATVTPAPDTPNPCGLVTLAEAGTALDGRPLPGQMRRSRDTAEVRCTYTVLLGADGRTAVVSVWKGTEAAPVFELRRSVYAEAAEDMAGLGDRAFVVRGDEGWVNILKGDIYLSVQVEHRGISTQELRSRALTLARLALGRL